MIQGDEHMPLQETSQETDLGVVVDHTLKPTAHCKRASRNAMYALKQLRTTFGAISKDNFNALYKAFIRPHIEYCSQAVGPYMVKNLQVLERIQRRATKMVRGLKNVPYQERLIMLQLTSVKQRLLRGDLIEVYKILTGRSKLKADLFFERSTSTRTRGHHLKLEKRRAVHRARNEFFSHRVVNHWNQLPSEVVSAPSTNCFKNRLDQHWATI